MTAQTVLLDLDDTLISAYRNPEAAWLGIAQEFAEQFIDLPAALIGHAVARQVARFHRHGSNRRLWRLTPTETRRSVVLAAFEQLHEEGLQLPDSLALAMADRYESYRSERMALHPDALEMLDTLRVNGHRLGLLTNGSAHIQRSKIERFALAPYFDHIQIEGEFGLGKPNPTAYQAALAHLGASPTQSLMIGDDIGMDVLPVLKLGMRAIWYNPEEECWPQGTRPARVTTIAALKAIPDLVA